MGVGNKKLFKSWRTEWQLRSGDRTPDIQTGLVPPKLIYMVIQLCADLIEKWLLLVTPMQEGTVSPLTVWNCVCAGGYCLRTGENFVRKEGTVSHTVGNCVCAGGYCVRTGENCVPYRDNCSVQERTVFRTGWNCVRKGGNCVPNRR